MTSVEDIKMNVMVIKSLLDDMTDENISSPLKDFINSRLNHIARECDNDILYSRIQNEVTQCRT